MKSISNSYIKVGKKFVQFFQDKSLGQKKAPAGSRRAKKRVFEKHKQGVQKKGSAKGMKKKSLKVISGHDGRVLHPKGMADGSTTGTC